MTLEVCARSKANPPNPLLQGTASQRRCAPPLAAPEQQR